MKFTPNPACKAVRVLVGGRESHHIKPVVIRMRLPDGTLATINAGNDSVLNPHFEHVYTRDRAITWEAFNDIPTCDTVKGINQLIKWEEV